MAKRSGINRIRTLYAIFFGVIVACIVLFVLNIVHPADPLSMAIMGNQNKDYGVIITDLNSSSQRHAHGITVEGMKEGLSAEAYVSRYDVNIATDSEQLLHSNKAIWCTGLQIFSVLAAVAITILVILALISLYINTRQGKVFPKRNIRRLTWAGALMIVMSLCMDISSWIENSLAMTLLQGSDWQPSPTMAVHTTRIFFGLTIIFLSEIFAIGREMQEEQELTI